MTKFKTLPEALAEIDRLNEIINAKFKPSRGMREFERLAALETDDCVLWARGKAAGYGRVRVQRQLHYTHRLALERRVPQPPDRRYVLHQPNIGCDKACMNYRHLRWGTAAENVADAVAEGRRRGRVLQ